METERFTPVINREKFDYTKWHMSVLMFLRFFESKRYLTDMD